jgi:hypothetical protein
MVTRAPVDSSEAAEQREIEEARRQEAERRKAHPRPRSTPQTAEAARPHDPRCVGGWLGADEEERPIACPTCRPHLAARAACGVCGQSRRACAATGDRHGGTRCCDHCTHVDREGARRP